MQKAYDVIVVGLGGMGSAAAAELAGRGLKVLGTEQYGPAHKFGSSHGETRVVRQAYFEGPAYVPLILRSYQRWRQLEAATGTDLLTETGGLMIGPETSRAVAGSRASAEQWGLDYQLLDAGEIARRWPTLSPAPTDVALFERHAGFVRPEAAVSAQVAMAQDAGAELHFHEVVTGWQSTGAGTEVTTDRGTYRGARLVLAPGAWAPDLLAPLDLPLVVERHVLFWLRSHVPVEMFSPDRQPVYIWEGEDGDQAYGFPALGDQDAGVKAVMFRHGSPARAPTLERAVGAEEVAVLLEFLGPRIPALGPRCAPPSPVCTPPPPMSTSSSGSPPVTNASLSALRARDMVSSSSSVIGEVVADLVTTGASAFDLSLFDPDRFRRPPSPARTARHRSRPRLRPGRR